ncbi:MAG: YfhO family protein [Elusimicrobiota bacterium]|nr:YfhO family protein [Elusimicrobiota bacterium]
MWFKFENFFYDDKNLVFSYSVLFVLLASLLFGQILFSGFTFIFEKQGDCIDQHLTALIYFGSYLRSAFFNFLSGNFNISLYDFNIGYGADVIVTFHYYVLGDPFALLSFFVPQKYTVHLYDFLIVLKLYLSGLAFAFCCFKTKVLENSNSFSILIGSLCYVFCGYSLFLVLIPNFLNSSIYFPLILVGADKIFKDANPCFFIFMIFVSLISNYYLFYIISAMLFVFSAIKVVVDFDKQNYKRITRLILCYAIGILAACIVFIPNLIALLESSRFKTSYTLDMFYDIDLYKQALLHFIKMPYKFLSRQECMQTTGFFLITLISVIILFFQKKKYLKFKITFILLTIFALFPVFGYALTGFAYVTNRWMFAYNFIVCLITVFMLPLITQKNSGKRLVLIFTIANIIFNSYWIFKSAKASNKFIAISDVVYLTDKNRLPQMRAEAGFWRTDISHFNKSIKNKNYSLLGKTKTTSSYFSSSLNPNVYEFFREMEIPNVSANVYYDGLDSRAMLCTLANVKYFVVGREWNYCVPYGYNQQKNYEIYENRFALPFGYSYKFYISREVYNTFSAIQKQQILMQSTVLDEPLPLGFKTLKKFNFRETIYKVPIAQNEQPKNQSTNLTLSLKNKSIAVETYIKLIDVLYLGKTAFVLKLDDTSDSKFVLYDSYYTGNTKSINYMLNTKCIKDDVVKLNFFQKSQVSGRLFLKGIEINSLPLGQYYEEEINLLKKEHLKNVKELTNKVKGEIKLSENKIVLFTIPYSKGWSVFVNGKKEKLLRANTMFSAIALKAGKHEIELRYFTPGLKLGFFLSLLGCALFVILLKKHRKAGFSFL